MKNNPYHFFDQLILRLPRLEADLSVNTDEDLKLCLANEFVMEALYLASQSTYYKAQKWLDGETLSTKELNRLRETLTKYFIRMSNRCTPFGLFAGCGMVEWAENAQKIIAEPTQKFRKFSRIDSQLIDQIKTALLSFASIRNQLEYYPNTTLYQIGDKLRYVDFVYENETRKHSISKVDSNEYLELILTQAVSGKTPQKLAELIVLDDITLEAALEFVETLIDEKLLVSKFELSTTEKNHVRFMLERAWVIGMSEKDVALQGFCSQLEAVLDEMELHDLKNEAAPNQYQAIVEKISTLLQVEMELKNVIQTDLIYDFKSGQIPTHFQPDLLEAFTILNRLSAKRDIKMEEFAKKFYRRYGDAEIPLLEALDHDLGIGYKNYNNEQFDNNPLLENFIVKNGSKSNEYLIWNAIEDFLHQKYTEANKKNAYSVSITAAEVESFALNWDDLPETTTLIFSHVGRHNDKELLHLKSVGGINGSYLLGRFAFADQKIANLCEKITQHECLNHEEVILADVNHVPQLRDVNVMVHPNSYGFEIAYLAAAADNKVTSIPLSDLYISAHNNQIYMRSKALNKRVVPRINTAHNYHQGVSHHIYSFLGDLQFQGIRPVVHFEWDALSARQTFLPRVIIKNIIVSKAKWKFEMRDVPFLEKNTPVEMQKIDNWRKTWQIPRYVELVENRDNKLKIDLTNLNHLVLLQAALEKNQMIDLEEVLFESENGLIKNQQSKAYRNEFIAALFQDKQKQNKLAQKKINHYLYSQKIDDRVQRRFMPGSEWVYYEFYCGFRSADDLLLFHIQPLMEQLLVEGKIIKWFFIRFNIPENHIRLRMLLPNTLTIGEITTVINNYTGILLSDRIISKVNLSTYERELERYGSKNIELSESLFFHDSVAVLQLLETIKTGKNDDLMWLAALRNIQAMLNDFEWDLASKIDFLDQLSRQFGQEFNLDSDLQKQLNNHYRKFTSEIEMALQKEVETPFWQSIDAILKERSAQILPLAKTIIEKHEKKENEVSIQSLTASYTHMTLNRFFKSQPRFQEMIIYYLLAKYYKAQLARLKKKM